MRPIGLLLNNLAMGRRGGGVPITWLIKASFDGPDLAAGELPAELGAPYVEVGTLELIGGAIVTSSISAGSLSLSGTTNYFDGAATSPDILPRTPGLTIIAENAGARTNSFSPSYNATVAGNAREGFFGSVGIRDNNVSINISPGTAEGTQNALVLWEEGAGYFVKQPGDVWKLWWVGLVCTEDGYAFSIKGNAELVLNSFWVFILPALDDEAKLPGLRVAIPVSGTSYTATADAIHDLTVTAPDPMAESAHLRYRVTDDDNYWDAYLNDSGAFRLDSVAAGTPTNRINVAGAIAAGQTHTMRMIANGTRHNAYTLSGTTWTKRGGEINHSHQDTATTIKPVAGAGWTLGALRSYPTTSAAYAELDQT